jgi:signal transduction histidine kinase
MASAATPTTQQVQQTRLPIWQQLRWNLILYFVFLAIVPVVVVQAITLSLTTQDARAGVIRQLESIASLKSNQLQRWTQEAQSTMGFILADSANHAKMVEVLTSATPASHPQGEVTRLLHDLMADQSGGVKRQYQLFKDLFLYDRSGRVLAASQNDLIGRVVNRQPYFESSLKGIYLQPPFYALGNGELTMVFSYPVFDATKQIVGVLAGRLEISTLGQIMAEQAGLGHTGETYLVSAENNYLLTPSRFEGYPLNLAYHSEGIDKALQGSNGIGVYASYRGKSKPVIGVYRWIPGLQAALLAEIEESEALSAAAQVLTSSVIVTALAALIAVVIGFIRISQISAPIGALTQVASRIAAGDLTQRAAIRERNEIGLLAASFNGMTEQLVTNITVLDQNLHEIDKANRALQVATAKAKEAARVKGEFLANVSHELRTPLNAIIGFSDMLLMGMSGPLNQKQHHKVARLKENGSRLLTLINDLLDLTRIEAGRLETVQNAFSPRAMVERIAAQMESLADQTKLRFDTTVDVALPPTVIGDEKRTEQVIVNLLSNAFKFTKEGGVSMHVYVDHRAQTWNIDVTDTGIGIPPHALDLIFEEFRQLDGSYSRAFKGTGLGLAITRNLVRMMNGKITVKSTLGVGSTFSVTIPLITDEQAILAREEAVA